MGRQRDIQKARDEKRGKEHKDALTAMLETFITIVINKKADDTKAVHEALVIVAMVASGNMEAMSKIVGYLSHGQEKKAIAEAGRVVLGTLNFTQAAVEDWMERHLEQEGTNGKASGTGDAVQQVAGREGDSGREAKESQQDNQASAGGIT